MTRSDELSIPADRAALHAHFEACDPRAMRAHYSVEVDLDSEASRVLATWLRAWRRREVRHEALVHLHQGAVQRHEFIGPERAFDDLKARLIGMRVQLERVDT